MANIQSLPNELLEDILDIICKENLSTPLWQQFRLSHVNRRFRELAINDARLWSHITFTSSVEWVEILLQRSGSHDLIIDLADHHPSTRDSDLPCSCPDMVSRALVHKDRWREVRMGARFNNDKVDSNVISLMKNFTLPSLRRLTFPEDTSDYYHLCMSWSMPALEHLTCSDYDYVLELTSFPLKSLRYTEHSDYVETTEVVQVHNRMKMVSVVGVEELTLRFTKPLAHWVHSVYNTVRMENLRSFTVDFTTTPNEAAEKLFEYLNLPGLKVFELKHDRSQIFSTGNSSDEDLLQPYLHGLNWLLVDYHDVRTRFPRLKEVRVMIDGVEDEKLCDTLRNKLGEKFQIEWFGGELGSTGEEKYVEVVASAPQVHFWTRPRRDEFF